MKKPGYFYDERSFRLNVLRTTRNNGQDVLQDLNYTYDAAGNITTQQDNAQQTFYFNNQVIAPTGTYTYDALYRLLTATGRELTALQMPTHEDFPNNIPCPTLGPNAMQNYTHHYQYNELGNMLQMSSQNQWTRDYIYDTATNRLLRHTQQLPNTYSYDAHGNILTMPHLTSISWDYLDQLHSATNGTFSSYYNYDAEGNRTRKVVVKGNITEIRYYIGNYELYQKHVNGSLDFERTTLNISDDEKVFVRIEQKTGENPVIRYQYDNHLGSACLELDELGAIISYEEYHPFGTTSYRSGRSETEVSLKRYKYCGKERDEETGLYYYGMRYYAAWICRFVSVDPLQFKYPYYTPYQYAGNKPISYIDLDGGEEKKLDFQRYYMRPFPEPDPMGGLGLALNKIREIQRIYPNQVLSDKNQEILKEIKKPVAGKFESNRYVVYENEIKVGGSLAWRNNNPGNIIKGSFSENHGAIGSDNRFAIFPDKETGFNAIIFLLKTEKYNTLSIADAIMRYAPPEDNNDPKSYAEFIAKQTGLSIDRILNTLTEEELNKVAKVIETKEGFVPGKTYTLKSEDIPDWAKQLLQQQQTNTNENKSN